MPRSISTAVHGGFDYTFATAIGAAPNAMANAPRTAHLLRTVSAALSLNAAVTNYEAGLMRLMPMKAHLAVEALVCAALVASPVFLPRAERRWAFVPVVAGLLGLATGLMTRTDASTARVSFRPSRDLSEAVADPDVAEAM